MSARKKVNQSRPRALAAGAARLPRAPFASLPPATKGRRRRGGPADRRQTRVLRLTAHDLRRRRGTTASVFGRMPLALGPPSLARIPPYQPSSVGRSTGVCSPVLKCAKAAILRKGCEFHELARGEKVPKFQMELGRANSTGRGRDCLASNFFFPERKRAALAAVTCAGRFHLRSRIAAIALT